MTRAYLYHPIFIPIQNFKNPRFSILRELQNSIFSRAFGAFIPKIFSHVITTNLNTFGITIILIKHIMLSTHCCLEYSRFLCIPLNEMGSLHLLNIFTVCNHSSLQRTSCHRPSLTDNPNLACRHC